jgi:very-short-patch-repair endonuclease
MENRSSRVAPQLLDFARDMRQKPAPAEQTLWYRLRDRRLNGFKFRRQVAIGSYIAEFLCASCKLIVELDGDSHADRQPYDEQRTAELREQGFEVIRFLNTDVHDHLDAVLLAILRECEARSTPNAVPSPPPSPLSTGERE